MTNHDENDVEYPPNPDLVARLLRETEARANRPPQRLRLFLVSLAICMAIALLALAFAMWRDCDLVAVVDAVTNASQIFSVCR